MEFCYSESMLDGDGWPRTNDGSRLTVDYTGRRPEHIPQWLVGADCGLYPYEADLSWSCPPDEDVKPAKEDLLLSGDPFVFSESSFAPVSPPQQLTFDPYRKEGFLTDHVYCRKAPDVIVKQEEMDLFGDIDIPNGSYLTNNPSCSNEVVCTNRVNEDWMEEFQQINQDDMVFPNDLENINVDWNMWNSYLGEDDKVTTIEQPSSSYSMPTSPGLNIKIEDPYGLPIKEEIDVDECIARPLTPGGGKFVLPPKSRRGRPKKIRIQEDKTKMTAEERRKAMNRDAALRYREKKKVDSDNFRYIEFEEVEKNTLLKHKVSDLEEQIKEVREAFRNQGFCLS